MLVISGGYPGYPRPPPYLPMAGPVYWPGPGYPSPPISPPGGGSYYLPGPLLSTPASSLSSLSTVAVSPGPPHPASPPPPASQQHNTLLTVETASQPGKFVRGAMPGPGPGTAQPLVRSSVYIH